MLAELLAALMALVMAILFLVDTFSFPVVSSDPGGLALVPRIAAGLTLAMTIVLLARLARNKQAAVHLREAVHSMVAHWNSSADSEADLLARRLVWICVLCVLYPFAILKVGFAFATFLFAFALLRLHGSRLLLCLIFSNVIALSAQAFFKGLLGAYVPTGTWINALFDFAGI